MPDDNTVTIEGATIIFRNFEGKEGPYNRKGDRGFTVVLDEPLALAMREDGWNVKQFPPKDDDTPGDFHISVSVSYKNYPPRITLISSSGRQQLSEERVEILDWADMKNVDLILNPYSWEVNGKIGIKAYLKTMFVTLNEDELERKYALMED